MEVKCGRIVEFLWYEIGISAPLHNPSLRTLNTPFMSLTSEPTLVLGVIHLVKSACKVFICAKNQFHRTSIKTLTNQILFPKMESLS